LCGSPTYPFSFSLPLPPPPTSPLFPYTPLFRSYPAPAGAARQEAPRAAAGGVHRRGRSDGGRGGGSSADGHSNGTGRDRLFPHRSEEHTSELQSRFDLVCRLLLEKKKRHNTEQL